MRRYCLLDLNANVMLAVVGGGKEGRREGGKDGGGAYGGIAS